jgi:hypothetical protein
VTGVVELRQYTLLPGRRDELVEVFDRELVETQESCGMRVLGQFRDEDRPDRFVWLRWFPDLEARRAALTAFYGGPVWREHGPAANVTMVDWDDVLLLEPVRLPEVGVRADGQRPPAPFWISVHQPGHLPRDQTDDGTVGLLVTLKAENTYPMLPVREDLDVVVRLGLTEPSTPALQVVRGTCTGRSLLP